VCCLTGEQFITIANDWLRERMTWASAHDFRRAAQSNPPAAPTQQAAQSSNTMDTPTFLLVVGSIAGAGVAAARVYIKNREKKIKN